MAFPSIFVRTLRDLRWQVFWYGVGLGALGALVVYVYPSYKGQLANFEIPEALQALIGEADYGTPEGFLSAEFFSWAPILGVVFAIMAGTSALAGEEAAGTLDLLLAQPVTRSRLVVEKLAGLAVSTLLIMAIIDLGWLLSVPFVEIDVSYGRLLLATLAFAPLTLLFALLATWCGALFPDRRLATGIVTAVAVASFFINYLALLVDALAPLRWISFFHYYQGSELLSEEIDPAKLAVLLGAAALFALLTVASFERREIGVRGGGLTLPGLGPGQRLKSSAGG